MIPFALNIKQLIGKVATIYYRDIWQDGVSYPKKVLSIFPPVKEIFPKAERIM